MLDQQRHQRLEAIFDHAVCLTDLAERESYLRSACRPDSELETEVRRLLSSYESWSREAALPPPVLVRCGPYECTELLASGGMGTVYRARRVDGQFDQEVAIKFLRGSLRSDAHRARFLAERQILAHLNHPHIAQLLDGGMTAEGEPYLVMELVNGQPLDVYCDQRQLGLAARLTLFRQVLAAVDAAHRSLVVHRDLKPSNVLVTADGHVKLLDFGTSKLLAPDASLTEASALTPAYASPEQLRGEPVATTSDVYSLGIVLFELLVGAPPFPAAPSYAAAIERALRDAAVPRPETRVPAEAAGHRATPLPELRRQLRGDLSSILLKALAHEPERRYPSVAALDDDLRRYLEGRPVLARPQSWTYVARKLVSRHRAAFAVAAVLILAVAAAATYAWRQQIQAAQRFEESRQLAGYLLFDLFDQVSGLPGSTSVRARMAKTAQDQLDRLAALQGASLELQRETIRGYHRLAEVYGVPGSANLGDARQARESLSRAQSLIDQARRRHPDDPELRLALAHNLLLRAKIHMWVDGQTALAAPLISAAVPEVEASRAGVPQEEWLRIRGFLRLQQADLADFEENWDGEERIARQGLAELGSWPSALQDGEFPRLARALHLRQVGNGLYYSQNTAGALDSYRAAEAVLRDATARYPNRPALLKALMAACHDVGTTLDSLDRRQESLAAIGDSVEIGKRLIAIEDRDRALMSNYAVARQAYAEALAHAGRTAEALREQQAVVEDRRHHAAESPDLNSATRDYAFSLFVLGQIQLRHAGPTLACPSWRTAQSLYQTLRNKGAITNWDQNQNVKSLATALHSCTPHPAIPGTHR